MRRSDGRILTTHTGGLPRPPRLLEDLIRRDSGEAVDARALDAAIRAAVPDSVRRQRAAGVGWSTTARSARSATRRTSPSASRASAARPGPPAPTDMLEFPEYLARERGDGEDRGPAMPACDGPIAYATPPRSTRTSRTCGPRRGGDDRGLPPLRPSPRRGDRPRDPRHPAGRAADARLLGHYEGPHHHDVPLRDIADIVLAARPSAVSFEAANPRHAHELTVFEPDGKALIPGVVDSTTNYIEHPELVAERIARYARLVGRENVIAGWDCGFASFAVSQGRPGDRVGEARRDGRGRAARVRAPLVSACGAAAPEGLRREVAGA